MKKEVLNRIFVLFFALCFSFVACSSDDDNKDTQQPDSNLERVDGSSVGADVIGSAYTDSKGNKIIAYISDQYDHNQIQITDNINPGSFPDEFPFVTNKFVKVTYPEEFVNHRVIIQVECMQQPNRVYVYDEELEAVALAPFDNSKDGVIEIKSNLSGRHIDFALVNE